MQQEAVKSIKNNLFRAWTIFGKQAPNEDQVILKAFKTTIEETDKERLEKIKGKIKCDCEKDPQFKFTCKKGIMWFANNREMLQKIRKKVL